MYEIVIFTGSSWIDSSTVKDPDADIFPVLRSIGAYQIASVLRDNHFTSKVVDYFPYLFHKRYNDLLKIVDKIVSDTTLWVGFSSTFFDGYGITDSHPLRNEKINHFVNYIKNKNKKIKIVLGGATAWRKEFPTVVDYYVEGYADDSVIGLTTYLKGKNPFFMINDRCISSDKTAANFNFSDYKFKWTDHDDINHNEVLPIEISRGCIFKCAYCSYPLNGKKKLDFIKDSSVLYDHFVENYERFGVTSYMYTDDTHNDSLEKLEYLHNNVYSKLPFKIKFNAYIRLDLLKAHPAMIDILKESGIRSCFFGIESMNYQANKTVGKGMRQEKIVETLHTVREKWNDVFLQGGFIIGLPNETKETASNWLDLVTDPAFPLDHITLNPLHLFRNQGENGYWFNDIEKYPEKYGYTFSSDEDWISNTGMTKRQAIEIKDTYRKKMSRMNKNKLSWMSMWRLQNLDIDLEDYKSMSKDNINSSVDNFINSYIHRCLNK
jgi:hypothetical protein